MRDNEIAGVVSPILAQHGLDLDAVEVLPAGKRRLVRIVVDGDGPDGTGPLLDDIAEATRAISAALDESPVVGSSAYTLEVSSRGVSRPLELPRHWRRNRGRLVAVRTSAGESLTGRVGATTDEAVTLEVDGATRELAYAEVTKALVQVELNRPRPTDPGTGSDEDDEDDEDLDEDLDDEDEDD
jgi:ribosome maturation factor RimP